MLFGIEILLRICKDIFVVLIKAAELIGRGIVPWKNRIKKISQSTTALRNSRSQNFLMKTTSGIAVNAKSMFKPPRFLKSIEHLLSSVLT